MKDCFKAPAWLVYLEKNTPELLQKTEIFILMRLTAAACRERPLPLAGQSAEKSLEMYRDFSADILTGRSREELAEIRSGMYRKAYRLGRLLALLPGMKKEESKKRLIILLYRNIGITLWSLGKEKRPSSKEACWRIRVPRCSFSGRYTPLICYVMSGLDAGIICGIIGGGSLKFTHRLTEGCGACSAVYRKSGGQEARG